MRDSAVPDTTGPDRAATAPTPDPPEAGGRQSLTRAARQRVPKPVKRAIARRYRAGRSALHAPRSKVDLMALKREYRARFGPGFVYTIDDRDEMFQFFLDFWSWPFHVIRLRARSDAMRAYLVSGDLVLTDLEAALRDQGRSFSELDSFLEFASGYGRFTRFLVTQVDARRVTVSDISRPAVDFARSAYGVSGFYSTESAGDLDREQQHEVVFVASLFSHLTIEHWNAWLQRLYELVAPGGLLIFSTHGPYARDFVYGDAARARLETLADGFSYLLTNETHGRLAEDYYGSAFVTEAYVRAQIAQHGLGTIKRVYPAKLWATQDLYVLEKPACGG